MLIYNNKYTQKMNKEGRVMNQVGQRQDKRERERERERKRDLRPDQN